MLGKYGIFVSFKSKNVAENITLVKARCIGVCKEVRLEKKIEREEPKKQKGKKVIPEKESRVTGKRSTKRNLDRLPL